MSLDRFVSYAQHGEDVILWRALGDRSDVVYVDVGAFHPTYDSVTRALYERGWRGLNIEAQPDRLAAFEQQRPEDTNLALAVGALDGTITLTLPDNPGWASTLDARKTGADIEQSQLLEVPCRRLDTLLHDLGIAHVDVLKVDVEGAEPDVIRGLLGGSVRPVVCVVEGVAPGLGRSAGDEAVELLVAAGYTHAMFDGLNHYLTTDRGLVPALSVPANPNDGFVAELVDRLLQERVHFHGTIAALAADNTALRETAMLHAPRVSAPSHTVETSSRAATAKDASAPRDEQRASEPPQPTGSTTEDDGDFQGGDLPSLTDHDVTGVEAGFAVPTAAVPAALEPPATSTTDEPLVDAETRRARRRRTFTRLLSGVAPTLPTAAPGVRDTRLNPDALTAMNPKDAVAALYQVVLGRAADPEGLTAWTARVESGEPLVLVAHELAHTAEARQQPHTQRALLVQDVTAWMSLASLDELGVGGWDVDRPYGAGNVAHEIFVEALYEVALQRRPTPLESSHEVAKLANGTGREWLLRAFAGRPDAQARILGASRGGVRGRLRRWRDRRSYLETFRTLVVTAESRQITRLLHMSLAAPTFGER